ncbi:hypothetical protein NE237_021827 [Protea cynaroides]|uniref:TF-B3 domain-containing protein n=1 Tax=Protea cynaroides TaxID=273540 RepID=A0A9Q0HD83_9MAGN|nr:hypothetical protein NE237_021827 [Protea cynaroides]
MLIKSSSEKPGETDSRVFKVVPVPLFSPLLAFPAFVSHFYSHKASEREDSRAEEITKRELKQEGDNTEICALNSHLQMEHNCRECKKWSEHWYWTHLEHTQIRFSRLLTAGFDQGLVVPSKIVSVLRKQLVNRVTLKSLRGKTWTIGLEKRDEELFFQQGWAHFVRGHSLNEGDILTFQYKGDSTFAVSVFDSMTGYEKVDFRGLPSNWETSETDLHLESMNNNSNDIINLESERSETESEDHNPPRKKGKSVCEEPNSRDTGKRMINRDEIYPGIFVSRRRQVSLVEKEKAHQLALAFQSTKPSFIVTMVPSSVSKHFFMTIPHKFVKENIPRSLEEAVLRVPPGVKKWKVTCGGYLSHGFGLRRGWKSFVLDNNLEQDDVCVFVLTNLPGNKNIRAIAMDVKIFRVTEAGQYLMKQEANATR